jgi:hypothetical protein
VLTDLRDETRCRGFVPSEQFFVEVAYDVGAAFQLRPECKHAFEDRYADLLAET